MNTAIRPTSIVNVPALDTVNKKGEGISDEEKVLYAMAKSAGWKIFDDIAKRSITDLNNVNKEAIAQGLPLEEIGRNAIVVSLAQGVIERLLNKVNDAVEACETDE